MCMSTSVDHAMQSLYEIAQGPYTQRLFSTTVREFTLNTMLIPTEKKFKSNTILMPQKKEFKLDSTME